jgi:hypothetical protein
VVSEDAVRRGFGKIDAAAGEAYPSDEYRRAPIAGLSVVPAADMLSLGEDFGAVSWHVH